jgi:hypothetical protein
VSSSGRGAKKWQDRPRSWAKSNRVAPSPPSASRSLTRSVPELRGCALRRGAPPDRPAQKLADSSKSLTFPKPNRGTARPAASPVSNPKFIAPFCPTFSSVVPNPHRLTPINVQARRNPVSLRRNPLLHLRNPVSLPRNLVSLPRNLVSPTRNRCFMPRNPLFTPENPVSLPRNPVSLARNPVALPENLVSPSRNLVATLPKSVSTPENRVSLPQNRVAIPQNPLPTPAPSFPTTHQPVPSSIFLLAPAHAPAVRPSTTRKVYEKTRASHLRSTTPTKNHPTPRSPDPPPSKAPPAEPGVAESHP